MNVRTISRREFLGHVSAVVGSTGIAPLLSAQTSTPTKPAAAPDVARVQSDFVVRGRRVHETVLAEMIDVAIQNATATRSTTDAWNSLLKPDDVIGLKFNSSGWEALGVGEPFAAALINSLRSAGFKQDQIIAIEAGEIVHQKFNIRKPTIGWDPQPTDFGSGQDRLAVWLDHVTAIINIPFLKTHNIAGVTGALKNLSHAVVRHPARFHANHCSPFIPDIVAVPKIRHLIRLHLVNALRIVFDGGPEPRGPNIWDGGYVMAATDPVAIDTVGREIINSQRNILGMPPIDANGELTMYLKEANLRQLGKNNFYRTDIHDRRI